MVVSPSTEEMNEIVAFSGMLKKSPPASGSRRNPQAMHQPGVAEALAQLVKSQLVIPEIMGHRADGGGNQHAQQRRADQPDGSGPEDGNPRGAETGI